VEKFPDKRFRFLWDGVGVLVGINPDMDEPAAIFVIREKVLSLQVFVRVKIKPDSQRLVQVPIKVLDRERPIPVEHLPVLGLGDRLRVLGQMIIDVLDEHLLVLLQAFPSVYGNWLHKVHELCWRLQRQMDLHATAVPVVTRTSPPANSDNVNGFFIFIS